MKIHISFTGLGAGNIGDEAMMSGFLSICKFPEGTTIEVWDKNEKALSIFPPCYEFVDFRDKATCRALCKASDVVLVIGTTLVTEAESLIWPLGVLGDKHMFCSENGIPVHAVGVGVDELKTPEARELFNRGFLHSINTWTVRSRRSRENLLKLGVAPERVAITADLAWLTPYRRTDNGWASGFLLSAGVNPDIPVLGVNVVNASLNNSLRKKMAETFDYVVQKMGWQVVFFCNEIRDEKGFDRAGAVSIAKKMKKGYTYVPQLYFTPQEMISLLSLCRMTVSFRYHFTVFSMLAGTVPVSFQRSEKLAELTEDVGGAALITADEIINGNLLNTIQRINEHYDEIKTQQQLGVSNAKMRALNNICHIKRDILTEGSKKILETAAMETQIKHILWIRTDALGDCILSVSMLREIKQGFCNTFITVVCQSHVAEIYESYPFADSVISFDKNRAYTDIAYQRELIEKLRALNADIALNSVYSREPLTDMLTLQNGAKETVAFEGDFANKMTPELKMINDPLYTKLIKRCGTLKAELQRNEEFLHALGLMPGVLKPTLHLTEDDIAFSERFFLENGLKTSTTIALLPGASNPVKIYKDYHLVVNQFKDFDVVIIGGKDTEMIVNKTGAGFKVRFINLAGKTTLGQCAAVISRCLIYLGADSVGAHMACAVGVPCVVVLGGAHIGRFFPYNEFTTTVSVPLDCYDCNWQCKYNICHCIDAIRFETVSEALSRAIEDARRGVHKCRMFFQGKALYKETPYKPRWKWFSKAGLPDYVEFVYYGGTLNTAAVVKKSFITMGLEWVRFLIYKIRKSWK